MKPKATSTNKKLNFKEKLDEDNLDLSLCSLETVPVKEIAELSNKARKLNLAYNAFTFLPEDFIKLAFIKELDLSKNRLKVLPKNFGALTNLKVLDLLGNQLTLLPSSFSELKNLRWLDLKDNPLDPELRKAVGECSNELQCKKCATNVLKYVKDQAAEEERVHQLQLKKKKDQQNKIEALERQKAELVKQQKKEEREQRRIMNEKRKREVELEGSEEKWNGIYQHEQMNASSSSNYSQNSSSFCSTLFKGLIYLVLFVVLGLTIYLASINYCERTVEIQAKYSSYLKNEYVTQMVKFVDAKVCPLTKIKHPLVENLLRSFNLSI